MCPYSKIYELSLRIQSKCRKIRTRITPNTDTFHAVYTHIMINKLLICKSCVTKLSWFKKKKKKSKCKLWMCMIQIAALWSKNPENYLWRSLFGIAVFKFKFRRYKLILKAIMLEAMTLDSAFVKLCNAVLDAAVFSDKFSYFPNHPHSHYVISVQKRSFFCCVFFRTRSEYEKIWTRKKLRNWTLFTQCP